MDNDRYSGSTITLRFSPILEREFSEWYFTRNVRIVRIGFLIAIFLYSIFGILDASLAPEVKTTLWLIRFAFFLPVTFGAFLLSFGKTFPKIIQPVSAAIMLSAGFGIVYMIEIAPPQTSFIYYAGLMLVLMYSYSFMRMKFGTASAVGFILIVAYEVSAVILSPVPRLTLVSNNFFLLSTNIIGMVAAYSIEYFNRQSFVKSKQIEEEKWNLKRMSQKLSKSVNERTEQLKVINQALREEIAEHKEADRELKRSESRYRRIIESITEGYIEVDTHGRITFFNDALAAIAGRTHDEIVGRSVTDFVLGESIGHLKTSVLQLTRTSSQARTINFSIKRPGGEERVLETTISIIRDPNGFPAGYRGLVRDVTARMQEEKELKRAKEAAVEASSAKSAFLANMSHELRTPLNHIIGFSELVLDERFGPLNESQVEFITDIHGSSKHLLSLINGILDISKIEAGKIELRKRLLSVGQFIEECISMIGDEVLKRNLDLTVSIGEDVNTLQGDEQLLKQVMFNLLSNAVKYSDDDSEIVVSAQLGTCDADLSSHCVKISVTDNGIGIRSEDQDSIFERFEQVDNTFRRRYPGTGLGLSLAKGIVELHGGKIWVESDGEGHGSTFSILLPVE